MNNHNQGEVNHNQHNQELQVYQAGLQRKQHPEHILRRMNLKYLN